MQSEALFYRPMLYVSISLFILGEGTVFLDLMKSIVAFYSHTVALTGSMVLTIFLGFSFGVKRAKFALLFKNPLMLPLSPILLFIVASYIDILVNLSATNVTAAYAAFATRYFLFAVMILQAVCCERCIKEVTKPYYHLTIIVLLAGVVLLLLSLTLDDIQRYSVDTAFLRKAGEGNLGKELYSMPFGLGLLITGQNLASFLGFSFPQFSSYFFEPQIFGFMMVPAFILFLSRGYGGFSGYRYSALAVSITLIAWAHSFTTIAALLGVLIVWIFRRNFLAAFLVGVVFFLIALLILFNLSDLSMSFSIFRKLTSSSGSTSLELFTGIWTNMSLFGDSALNIRIGEKGEVFSLLSVFVWTLFLLSVITNALVETLDDKDSPYGYALLFLFICYFKTLMHLPQSPISLYLILLFFVYKFSQYEDKLKFHSNLLRI